MSSVSMLANAFALPGAEVCEQMDVDEKNGLTQDEALHRAETFGKNELPPPESTPFLKLVIEQFQDTLVLILLGAAVISFLLAFFENAADRTTAFVEPLVILAILIANATVGVIQESNAESAIEALRKSEARSATIIRGGDQISVNPSILVPGDIVCLEEGDKVPADGRLLQIETAMLEIDESLLTGESDPASKHTDPINLSKPVEAVMPQERRNTVFSGTLIVRGKAKYVVTHTGTHTAMGEIAGGLATGEAGKTPLQQKLDEFGEQLSKVISVICVVVWLINIGHFTDPEHGSMVRGAIYYFKIAVALAVAAIPEGLPAVVTTCLALGTMRMAKKNAIVRKLPSVETLGCTTVICSDKTGTLTTNQMSVQHVVCINDANKDSLAFSNFIVDGDSFAPYGNVKDAQSDQDLLHPAAQNGVLNEIAKISTLCNESHLTYVVEEKKPSSSAKQHGVWGKTGSPTEAALKVLAEKLGVSDEKRCEEIFASQDPRTRVSATSNYWRARFQREHLLEFDRNRKSMSVIVQSNDSGKRVLLCKGTAEGVLDRCAYFVASTSDKGQVSKPMKMTPAARQQISKKFQELAARGLRCLALAYLEEPDPKADYSNLDSFAKIESNMTFVGLVGMLDPPRVAVAQAIQKCYQAGIRVIVITGDAQATAESIARRIGVFSEEDDLKDRSVTGSEFAQMTPERQEQILRTATLFSQVQPKHKSKIVEILKRQNEIVAMTGDGVNDALALKIANIGIAMGSGTDVAREASDMVLQDDNFATIVMAVEEGRAIYSNTRQFIRYLISSNIGEVVCIFLTAAIGMPEALIPVQLLWVNLVTDGLPATALGFNSADKDVMTQPPRSKDEPIVNGWMFFRYVTIGTYVGVGTVLGFIWWYLYAANGPHISFSQLLNFHSCSTNTELYPNKFDCSMFHNPIPSTISLSILVLIEMFNALNALSENQSLLVVPPWSNIWVLAAIALSLALHVAIVYIPFFSSIFHVAPLGWSEWEAIFWLSFPVLILDEVLKLITRSVLAGSRAKAKRE